MKTIRSACRPKSGFSMIETMCVISIIAILSTLIAPLLGGALESRHLQNAAAILRDQLQLARQNAITKSRPVEVRIYKDGNGYFAIKSVYLNVDNSESPSTRLAAFSGNVVITDNRTFSTLPDGLSGSSSSLQGDNSGSYLAFRFKNDGSTDLLQTSPQTMTLIVKRSENTVSDLPKNFITIEINPITGKTRLFQP